MEKKKISRRELNKINCRGRILKASRRLFSANGYENTRIEEVAEKAEVSRATLYNYFPNKDALLIGIAEEELGLIHTMVGSEQIKSKRADEKIRQVLEVFVIDSLQYLTLSRKITYLNSCEDSNLYATRIEMRKIFKTLVLEAQQDNIFKSDIDAGDIVDIIISIYLMAQFEWTKVADYSPEYCSEKLNRFFNITLAGIYR